MNWTSGIFTAASGCILERSQTYRVLVQMRPIPLAGAPLAEAIALAHHLRAYVLASSKSPTPNRFIDPSPMRVDTLPHYDLSVFHDLSDFLQIEPIQPADAAVVGALARLGIEKGRPFKPDAATATALTEAAKLAYAMLQQDFVTVGQAMIPYWPGSEWTRINVPQSQLDQGFPFFADGRTLVDERAQYFFWILGTFKRSAIPLPVYYLTEVRAHDGALLAGRMRYRLHVPADVPAGQFWSATVYSAKTKSFIAAASRVSVSSYDRGRLHLNSDGSVDLYFGGSPPRGLESNWLPTGEPFFVVFRLYLPKSPLFDGKWRLNDIEKATR